MVKNRKWLIFFNQDLSIKLKNYYIDRLWSLPRENKWTERNGFPLICDRASNKHVTIISPTLVAMSDDEKCLF